MNKTALKNFATAARLELIARVTERAESYGITAAICKNGQIVPSALFQRLGGGMLTDREIRQRDALIRRMESRGFAQVMEETAYTWFNRFVALRYMQEHNLLPISYRILPDAPGLLPEIVQQAHTVELSGVDPAQVMAMIDHSQSEALYKYLLLALCNQLNASLPQMFERIGDETELLLPDGLLRDDSVLAAMCAVKEEEWVEIQVVGWLYQYYISQRHDEVVNINGGSISKDDIPAATCLYTTEWVVRYVVENTLGRAWLDGHPNETLQSKWQYYMTEAEQMPQVAEKLQILRTEKQMLTPEELKVLDPCMGSGHMLVYAFDVLMDVYRSVGYTDRDAAKSIIENNLYGLDIDERAAQMAYFCVMMKACEYDRRFLRRGVQPHVFAIQEWTQQLDQAVEQVRWTSEQKKLLEQLKFNYTNAKEYGSLIQVDADLMNSMQNVQMDAVANVGLLYGEEQLTGMLAQTKLLMAKYDAVVTNPPYMNKFGTNLKRFIQDNYADYKSDLFAAFIYRNFAFCKQGGYSGFMTPFVWMFIKSYEALRHYILQNKSLTTLIQMEYSAFEEATVPVCTFVACNAQLDYCGNYLRLSDFKGGMDVQNEKVLEAQQTLGCTYRYTAQQANFSKIPGSPVAYWVSKRMIEVFEKAKFLGNVAATKNGMTTGNNDLFLRKWVEVNWKDVLTNARSIEEAIESGVRWFPYNKGGEFRKWYGNNEYVVNWKDDGYEIKHFIDDKGKVRSYPRNPTYYFQKCFSWSLVSSSVAAFRYKPDGHIFDVAGMSCFADDRHLWYLLALCNTNIAMNVLAIIAPTINYQCGDIANIPVIENEATHSVIDKLTQDNIALSRTDWDSFETSWDFKKHPLI